MSGMNEYLAEAYGTAGDVEGGEDLEKQAEVEFFAKLAAAEGIDLNELTDDQIGELWGATFGKEAEEDEEEGEDEDEKKKRLAAMEVAQKKESADKVAEADYCGRVMAHAFTQELNSIQKEAGPKTEAAWAAVKNSPEKVKELAKAYWKTLKGEGTAAARQTVGVERALAEHGRGSAPLMRAAKGKVTTERAKRVGAAAPLAVLPASAAAAVAGKESTASALDELAFEQAVVKAAEAGWDAEEAAERVMAVATLGMEESEKLAYAQDVDDAVGIRSLEILEAAGYPINWE